VLASQLGVKGAFMKKVKSRSDELRTEYKRSNFKKLERDKYYERIRVSSNVVVLDPEVAAVFPNSAALNEALHSLVEVAESVSGLTSGSNGR
jgi:site-specific DNA-adenine methylase